MLTNLRTWFCRSVMTLLLMLPVTLGWAKGYIHWGEPSNSNWSDAELTYNGKVGTVDITLEAGKTYGFLFKDTGTNDKEEHWYKFSVSPQEVADGISYALSTSNSGDGRISNAKGGTYTFTVTWSGDTPSISVKLTANAQSTLAIRSNKTGWEKNTPMKIEKEGTTWSYTLDVTDNPTYTCQFRFVDTSTNKWIFPNEKEVVVPIDNTLPVLAVKENDHKGNIFTFTGSGKYLEYLITVEYKDEKWGVYVRGQKEIPDYYINSNGTQVKGVLKNNKYYFTLPNSCYTNGKLEFSISKSSNTSTTYLTASPTTLFSGHNNTKLTGITDGTEQETKFSYTTNGLVNDDPDGDIEVVYDSKENTLTLYYKSRQEVMESAFYLIVPNANVGNTRRAVPASEGIAPPKHTAFRLMPGRERNQSKLNNDLTSINLKIDGDKGQQLRYDSEGKIKFYIQKGKQKSFFQPTNNENDIYVKKTNVSATNGVDGYDVRSNTMSNFIEGSYFIIRQTDADGQLSTYPANNNKTMSLTFMFSENNGEHKYYKDKSPEEKGTATTTEHGNSVNGFTNNGNLIVGFQHTRGVGSAYYNDHINKSGSGVYLVGAMGGAYTKNKKYPMEKIVYPSNATDADADSIVYVCEVKKGDNKWDNFFLSFSTGNNMTEISNDDYSVNWNKLLRPHVQDQMDGQALEGGVFFFKNDGGVDNQQQALNPLLSETQKNRYVSYKVYFNATYSTYRIEFYDNFYIAGPAVHGVDNTAVNTGKYFEPDYRLAMRTEEVHGVRHYVYTGEFTNGSTFAFFVNPETYTYNYSEDDDWKNVSGNTGTMWTTQAPTSGGKDYPFHNHVRWNTDGINPEGNTSGSLGQSNNGIKWTLPTGTYTLRFYNHAEKSGNNQLYTIDKVVTLKNATSEFVEKDGASVKHNYGGWRTFSDDCALWLPNGIKAYYASEITGSKVKLTEVADGMIPAHTGVLIYDGNLLADSESEDIHLYPVPTDYTTRLGKPNLFVDCYDRERTISHTEKVNNNYYYNYFFTCFYKKLGDFKKSHVPMSFWKTRDQNALAKKNYTYLHVSTTINPVAFNSNTMNYEQEPDATNVANNARDYCFLFSLDDLDDPLITGITAPAVENSMETKAEGWYTMQGVKIQKPAKAGMYILNGRKVIVR